MQLAFDIEGLINEAVVAVAPGVSGVPLQVNAAYYPRRQAPSHWVGIPLRRRAAGHGRRPRHPQPRLISRTKIQINQSPPVTTARTASNAKWMTL